MTSALSQVVKNARVDPPKGEPPLSWSYEKIVWVALRAFSELALVATCVGAVVAFIGGSAAIASSLFVGIGFLAGLSGACALAARVFKSQRVERVASALSFQELTRLYSLEDIAQYQIVSQANLAQKIRGSARAKNPEDIEYIRRHAGQLRTALEALSLEELGSLFKLDELFNQRIVPEWCLIRQIYGAIENENEESCKWIGQNIQKLFDRELVTKNVFEAFKGNASPLTLFYATDEIQETNRLASQID